jgi:hypothetical protein
MNHLVYVGSSKWSFKNLVFELLSATTANRASLGAWIELYGQLLFFCLFGHFSSLPVFHGVECIVIFLILWLGHSTPTQVGSALCSAPPLKTELIFFSQFIWPPVLSRRGAICSLALLDYVVLSRVNDVVQLHSTESGQLQTVQASSSSRFCVSG